MANWLEARTGYRGIVNEALDEPIPGGARWRYVFGSCLTGAFALQLVTGLLLMTTYSPSATTAWGSVYFITNEMQFGWLLRGLHHFGAQAMIVVLGLHLLQVLLAGAYRAPREVNWWFGLALLTVTLGLGLTGYLLPWDQKGYWATKVATNIMASVPLVGPGIQKAVVGGIDYGNQTLTRFYALHVGILPMLLVLLLVVHVMLFRRHGVTHPENTLGIVDRFWPKQVFLDTVAIAVVFAIVAGLAVYEQFWRHGIPLDAPADPSSANYPARPEWFFLSLFQLLKDKRFSGENEVIGTVVVPTAIFAVLFALPLLDKILPKRLAHFVACGLVFAIAGGAITLTVQAMRADARDPKFQRARQAAEGAALRARVVAEQAGIPPEGAGYLLRRDPMTQGRAVFERMCLSCHHYDGHGQISRLEFVFSQDELRSVAQIPELEGVPDAARRAIGGSLGMVTLSAPPERVETSGGSVGYLVTGTNDKGDGVTARVEADGGAVEATIDTKQTASDVGRYGSAGWLRGLLEAPGDRRYFGAVPQCGGMKRWKRESKLSASDLNQIASFFATHVMTVPEDLPASEWIEREKVQSHPAFKHFQDGGECALCHVDWVYPNEEAPSLYGWGTTWWIERMIRRPGAPHYFGYLDSSEQMPGFEDKLTESDLRAVVRYLKGEYVGAEPAPDASAGQSRPVSPL
jgi:quinol-cytochrome oxidoreductase complex cytochrome b subunit